MGRASRFNFLVTLCLSKSQFQRSESPTKEVYLKIFRLTKINIRLGQS